jgi:cell division protein FtsQ
VSVTSILRRSEAARSASGWRTLRRWGLFVVGLAGVLVAVWSVTNSSLFRARDVRVYGNHHLSSEEIVGTAGLGVRTNVLWMSTGTIERKLEANPWVREARVERTPPSLVEVTVVERTPAAVVFPGPVLVSGDGVVLSRATGAEATGLPRVEVEGMAPKPGQTVPRLPQFVAAGALPGDLLPIVERIQPGPNETLTVRTRQGVKVLFGDQTDASEKWAALRGILDWAAGNGVQVRYIDVRSPIAPALRAVEQALPTASGSG